MLSAVWNWLAHTVDWGDAQGLITWVVAAFALFYAARAAKATKETNKNQSRQIKALEEDQERRKLDERESQARLVVIWFVYVEQQDYLHVRLSNASKLPVANVVVRIWSNKLKTANTQPIAFLPPVENFTNQDVDIVFNRYLEMEPDTTISTMSPDMLTVSFTDINGRRWTRNLAGQLVKLHVSQSTKFDPISDPETSGASSDSPS